MAWLPISNTVLQYADVNGVPYSGAVLKFYAAGTSTNIPVATSQTGTPKVTSVALNSSGFPAVSGNVVVLFIDQDFKVALYPTQAAADSNTGALWTIDNIDPFAVLTLPTNLTDINALTPADGTIIVGDGTKWVAESGNTARTSLGLGTGDSPQFTNVTLSGLTTGHVVLANSAGALTALNVTAKGSIIAGDGAGAPITLAAGTNGQVISYDSTAASGLIPLTLPRDLQTFTASGTWTKPVGAKFVMVEQWSGGGGGARNTSTSAAGGGSGGEYVFEIFQASSLGATETVTVGAGGAGRTGSTGAGSAGGTSSFGSHLSAVGGNGGSTGTTAQATVPRSGTATVGTANLLFTAFVLPQAGGGGPGQDGGTGGNGQNTLNGGAGGGGSGASSGTGGTSAKGGNGGAGKADGTTGVAGSAPGGGGGGASADGNGGDGGRGEVRVYTW